MLILGLVFGIALGAILMLSGLSNPRLIIDMLRFKNLHAMKVLMTALAVGILGIALLDTGGFAHMKIKTLHVLAVTLGGGLLGLGFAVAGYCPGSALVASVEGRRDALFTLLGGLLGTGAYALAYPALKPLLLDPATYGKATIHGALGISHLVAALVVGGAFAAVVLFWLRSGRSAKAAETAAAGGSEPQVACSTGPGGPV